MGKIMKRSHLLQILNHLLHESLPGYSIQNKYTLPDIAATVDFVASIISDDINLKKIFIQAADHSSSELINTHAILKHEITQKGIFKGKDEYWLIVSDETTPELRQNAGDKFIKLLDRTWLKKEVSENLEKSKPLRETVETLESIGFGL